jgi:calcium/calmodulin-dependent protein kinase (CaM kinase) II
MNEHNEEHGDEPDFDDVQQLLDLNQQLLEAIASGNWGTYAALCDPTLSCFEPEARGHLVEGLEFHKFYFNLCEGSEPPAHRATIMSSPHVRLVGEEAAVLSYVRLNQRLGAAGEPTVSAVLETRVWERIEGQWKHVHFHRSPA